MLEYGFCVGVDKKSDFSVSCFQQGWVLISRWYPVKVLCSQVFASPHLWGLSPLRSLNRRLHLRHHSMCPGAWLPKRYQVRIGCSNHAFIHSPNPVQNLLNSIKWMGQDCAIKAHHPVRWHHNTHTYLRRVHCDGQGRHRQHKGYQTKCHRSYIYFPCVPRWCDNVTAHYLTEPNQKLPRRRAFFQRWKRLSFMAAVVTKEGVKEEYG